MLAECVASVDAQTLPATEHLIELDRDMTGMTGKVMNRAVRRSDCDWIAQLADDDLFLPHHLERHAEFFDRADIIYAYCEVRGRDGWSPNQPFHEGLVHPGSIPSTSLIRRSLWEKVGGWRQDLPQCEDGDFWWRAHHKGARFHCIEEITWVYRFHGDNKSLKKIR